MTRTSYSNHSTLSANRMRTQRNRKPFVEDPEKAVFLKGFKTNLSIHQAKEYREECYQRINKGYKVYIVKFDLPVNSADAFLHLKSVDDAQRLLGLNNTLIDENGEEVPYMMIEGDKIMVKTYKKTRKRIIEERRAGSNLTSRCSSRNPTRPVSPMHDEESNGSNGSRYNRNPLSETNYHHVHTAPESHRDSALETRVHSDNEEADDNIKKSQSGEGQVEECQDNAITNQIPMNIVEPQPQNKIHSPAENSYSVEAQDSRNPSSQAQYENGSFDSVTNAVESRLKSNDFYSEALLRQHWIPALDCWPQDWKVFLMVKFFIAFNEQGPDAAVQIIDEVKKGIEAQEIQNQVVQNLLMQLQGQQNQNQMAAGQLSMQ